MTGYELRIHFSDGFEVQTIEAKSIIGAEIIARTINPDALSVQLLATIDREPQKFLAW